MNYQLIYNQLIERARVRQISGYTEKHHIIPRSVGGTNNPDNLVRLTPREHLVCHILLAKIIGGKMWAALNRMTNFGEKNSRKYAVYRSRYANSIRGNNNPRYGAYVSLETRSKIGTANLGRIWSEKQKKTLSLATKGKPKSCTMKKRAAIARGMKKFNVFKLQGNLHRKIKIDKTGMVLIGQFESTRSCSLALGVHHQNIGKVLKGKSSHAGGYFFKFA